MSNRERRPASGLAVLIASMLSIASAQAAVPAPVPSVAPPPAAEPDSARLDLARTLLVTMRTEEQVRAAEEKTIGDGKVQFDKFVPAALASRLQIANASDFAVVKANIVGLLSDAGHRLIEDSLPIELDAMTRRYAIHYSADELRGLIAFYRSPLGQRVIAEGPAIAADNAQFQQGALKGIVASHMSDIGPKIAAMLAPLMRQAGLTPPAATPPRQPSGYSPL